MLIRRNSNKMVLEIFRDTAEIKYKEVLNRDFQKELIEINDSRVVKVGDYLDDNGKKITKPDTSYQPVTETPQPVING